MNEYEKKQQARKQRYLDNADKAENRAEEAFTNASNLSEAMVPGQPILVGHHSEKKHRKHLDKMDNLMRKGVEEDKKAEYYRDKADSVGTAGISADDPGAKRKLEDKVAELEASRKEMREHNKFIRKLIGNAIANKGGLTEESSLLCRTKLAEALEKDPENTRIKKAIDMLGARICPFAMPIYKSFELSNLGQNLTRYKKRLAMEQKKAEIVEKNEGKNPETMRNGVRILQNFEDNRLQLFFPGKPDRDSRTKLKKAGFRWSRLNGCWQAYNNNRALSLLNEVTKDWEKE